MDEPPQQELKQELQQMDPYLFEKLVAALTELSETA